MNYQSNIQAFKWTGNMDNTPEWFREAAQQERLEVVGQLVHIVNSHTNDGYAAVPGDHIIKTKLGFIHIMTDEQFKQSYETVWEG